MSALLTTTMPYMKVVIQTLKDRGIRDDYIVLVGGAPLNEEFGAAVGADAYCRDAGVAAETARRLDRRAPCQRGLSRPSTPPRLRRPRVLVIGCGALARELLALTRDLPGRRRSTCLDAAPAHAPGAHRRRGRGRASRRSARAYGPRHPDLRRLRRLRHGRPLDAVLEREGVERIAGAHCYEFYAGAAAFAALQDEELGTFYLTDFLARQFDRSSSRASGLDRHPELLPDYFGNYRRLVYLAQTDDPALTATAREAAADRLGLAFERRATGLRRARPRHPCRARRREPA